MSVDSEVADYLARIARTLPLPAVVDVPARRLRMEAIQKAFPPPPDTVARDDLFVTLAGRELLLRVYRPAAGTLPALVYFHGGGWVAGSVFTHDGACAALAQNARIVVVSVEYRRAPENPFPLPNDDALEALTWVAANAAALDVDPTRLAVGGDSAGAHLAASAALDARECGPALAFQLLVYPVIEPNFDSASYRTHATSPTLTRADMIDYWKHYLPRPDDARNPRAVPSRAASLAGLPRTHIVVAELDPLRDEGVRYGALLAAAGVAVSTVEARSLVHGFLRAAPYSTAARTAQVALGHVTGVALGTRA